MAKPRNSMVFLLTDEHREKLEAFRASRGLRSLAEAMRTLIEESGVVSRPAAPLLSTPAAPKPWSGGHPKPGKR